MYFCGVCVTHNNVPRESSLAERRQGEDTRSARRRERESDTVRHQVAVSLSSLSPPQKTHASTPCHAVGVTPGLTIHKASARFGAGRRPALRPRPPTPDAAPHSRNAARRRGARRRRVPRQRVLRCIEGVVFSGGGRRRAAAPPRAALCGRCRGRGRAGCRSRPHLPHHLRRHVCARRRGRRPQKPRPHRLARPPTRRRRGSHGTRRPHGPAGRPADLAGGRGGGHGGGGDQAVFRGRERHRGGEGGMLGVAPLSLNPHTPNPPTNTYRTRPASASSPPPPPPPATPPPPAGCAPPWRPPASRRAPTRCSPLSPSPWPSRPPPRWPTPSWGTRTVNCWRAVLPTRAPW